MGVSWLPGGEPLHESLIRYRCAREDHQRPAEGISDRLTIHQGAWAYCEYNTRAPGHEWVDIGGVPYAAMARAGTKRLSDPPARG